MDDSSLSPQDRQALAVVAWNALQDRAKQPEAKPAERPTAKELAVILCRAYPKAPDGCAALCMDRLGCIPAQGCAYALQVWGDMAERILAGKARRIVRDIDDRPASPNWRPKK